MDPKESDLKKYTSNSLKECVSEVDLEHPKELNELNNDYSLAPDKIEIKREILPEYQLTFADLCNIPIGNVKKTVLNFFDKGKYVLVVLLKTVIKAAKIHRALEFNQSQWLKPYIEFNTQNRNKAEKKMTKVEKCFTY